MLYSLADDCNDVIGPFSDFERSTHANVLVILHSYSMKHFSTIWCGTYNSIGCLFWHLLRYLSHFHYVVYHEFIIGVITGTKDGWHTTLMKNQVRHYYNVTYLMVFQTKAYIWMQCKQILTCSFQTYDSI